MNKHVFSENITKLKGIEFTSPEVDLLFKHFDQNKDGYIDYDEWTAKIYEDSTNSLALIREVVKSSGIDSDELLHKMGLRIWDDAIDLPTFNRCMRSLDPTLTD